MTRLPRDIDGNELAKALGKLGYRIVRQSGDHMRLTTYRNGAHHITIPDHRPLKTGTLQAILREVGRHHGLARDELLRQLFD
jgi:predicted RNA binding protein YcfA (HicA-like mRNA interferase family)